MITLTRRQARCHRGVFRRSVLGIAHRGPIPPLTLMAEGDQLRVRHRHVGLAVEHVGACAGPSSGLVALPIDALADLEGRDDATVAVEAVADDRTVARWSDRGIPRSREYRVSRAPSFATHPDLPDSWTEVPAGLLDTLADAAATSTEDSARYALSCLLIKQGCDGHEVVATDGRQLLIRGGFRLPWEGDVLVRASPVFAARELPRDRSWSIGRTETHVVLRGGSWTLHLEIRADARFPRVDLAFPAPDASTARLRLDPADAAFLADALGRLPGADLANAPVTVDLNGRVAVRARGEGSGPATELVLARSTYSGTPTRFQTNREFLGRAARLGFTEVEVVDLASPIVCRDGPRAYAWQPLDADSALGPDDDVVRIGSDAQVRASVARTSEEAREASTTREPEAGQVGRRGTAEARSEARVTDLHSPSLTELIGEAESLHRELAGARSRAGRLVVALKKHRRRERLMAATLASLRQFKLQDVPE